MKKKVWIFNHYAEPPQYEPRVRNNAMAKYMIKQGYDVTIFGASTIHNTDINLITDRSPWIRRQYGILKFVHINVPSYSGNGFSRKLNLLVFPYLLWKYTKQMGEQPDVIVNDLDVMAMDFPFLISKRYHVPIITEVRDLWPESLIVYGYLKRKSLLARFLYFVEKRMYKKSDRLIFTMEGGYDYIKEKGWDKVISQSKVFHINNGVDLEEFNYNKEHFQIQDEDLDNDDIFKVIYTGSIRKVNNLGLLLDVAKKIQSSKIEFLIWGDGNELSMLEKRVQDEKIENVVFKGRVDKKYIPYIISKADLNFMHGSSNSLFRFGISPNKMFDYFAAGKPIIMDIFAKYNPVEKYECGFVCSNEDEIISNIDKIVNLPRDKYEVLCKNSNRASIEYDFLNLTEKLIDIIEGK